MSFNVGDKVSCVILEGTLNSDTIYTIDELALNGRWVSVIPRKKGELVWYDAIQFIHQEPILPDELFHL